MNNTWIVIMALCEKIWRLWRMITLAVHERMKQCTCLEFDPPLVAQDSRECLSTSFGTEQLRGTENFIHEIWQASILVVLRTHSHGDNFLSEPHNKNRLNDRKHFKCEMQSSIKLITCAREVCAGRCDVTNTERSPQTLPQTQKSSRNEEFEDVGWTA